MIQTGHLSYEGPIQTQKIGRTNPTTLGPQFKKFLLTILKNCYTRKFCLKNVCIQKILSSKVYLKFFQFRPCILIHIMNEILKNFQKYKIFLYFPIFGNEWRLFLDFCSSVPTYQQNDSPRLTLCEVRPYVFRIQMTQLSRPMELTRVSIIGYQIGNMSFLMEAFTMINDATPQWYQ